MRPFIFALTTALIMSSTSAVAHPGSALLTTDSRSAPSAMSGTITFEEVHGVHVFKGSPLKADDALLGGEPVSGDIHQEVEIEILKQSRRQFRRMRTQGFYSGVPYPSRRYTQGFYSGQR